MESSIFSPTLEAYGRPGNKVTETVGTVWNHNASDLFKLLAHIYTVFRRLQHPQNNSVWVFEEVEQCRVEQCQVMGEAGTRPTQEVQAYTFSVGEETLHLGLEKPYRRLKDNR